MEKRDKLDALFRPRSVAIVGASDKYDQISGRPLKFFVRYGYKGKIFPVNPTTQSDGKGRIVDSTLVYFPPDEYKDLAPYTSVLVQLDNGCRLFAMMKGEHSDIEPGRPVTLVDQDEFRGALFFQLA